MSEDTAADDVATVDGVDADTAGAAEVRVELGRQRPTLTRFAPENPKPIEITDPVEITVDGRTMTVQKGDLLIDAVERHGVYIPRFCYHPRMEPVGMCRMCLVEVEGPRHCVGPQLYAVGVRRHGRPHREPQR